jgi:hypothetical protein
MKYFRVGPHDPATLHGQLLAASVPVITVRSSFHDRRFPTAMYGVVVTQDVANNGAVQVVIANHVASAAPPLRSENDRTAAQTKMETSD